MTEKPKTRGEETLSRSLELAKKILDRMPPWQREYAESIIEDVTASEDGAENDTYPKMFS